LRPSSVPSGARAHLWGHAIGRGARGL